MAGDLTEAQLAEWEREARASEKARAEADAVARECGLNRVPPSKQNARTLALISELRRLRASAPAPDEGRQTEPGWLARRIARIIRRPADGAEHRPCDCLDCAAARDMAGVMLEAEAIRSRPPPPSSESAPSPREDGPEGTP